MNYLKSKERCKVFKSKLKKFQPKIQILSKILKMKLIKKIKIQRKQVKYNTQSKTYLIYVEININKTGNK